MKSPERYALGIVYVACALFGPVISGFVLSTMWGWFISPLGVPVIQVPQAIGLSLIVNLLTRQRLPDSLVKKSTSQVVSELIGGVFVYPFLLLGIAYILTMFMSK